MQQSAQLLLCTLGRGIKAGKQIGTIRRVAQLLAKGKQRGAKFGQVLAQGAAHRRRERTGIVLAEVLDTLDERAMLAEGLVHQVPE